MMYYRVKEITGLDTTGLQLVGTLVALSFTLDLGARLLLQQDLAILMIRFMLEQMLLGGQIVSAIQEILAVGALAGGEDWFRELTPYERLTDVQKAFYNGYDEGYGWGLKAP